MAEEIGRIDNFDNTILQLTSTGPIWIVSCWPLFATIVAITNPYKVFYFFNSVLKYFKIFPQVNTVTMPYHNNLMDTIHNL